MPGWPIALTSAVEYWLIANLSGEECCPKYSLATPPKAKHELGSRATRRPNKSPTYVVCENLCAKVLPLCYGEPPFSPCRCPCVCGVMAATQKEPPRARRRGGSASCFCTAARHVLSSNPPAGLVPEISPGGGCPLLVGCQVPHGTFTRDLGVTAHPGVFVDVAAHPGGFVNVAVHPGGFVNVAAARGGFHMRDIRYGRLVIYRRGQQTDDRRWRPRSYWWG